MCPSVRRSRIPPGSLAAQPSSARTDPDVTLRPVEPEDEPFLRRVFAVTREDELARAPWTEEQKRAFLDMQFAAQTRGWAARFPRSEHRVVLSGGGPVGRQLVNEQEDEIRLIDLALLPPNRNRGTGTALLTRLQRRARTAGKPLRHSVLRRNVAARRFFRRLGFREVADAGLHVLVEWVPTEDPDRDRASLPR